MTARALIVAMLAAAFVLALVLLRPQPSATVVGGAENAQPPPLAAAERESAAIEAGPIAAPVANAPSAATEAFEPAPAAAPLPTGFVPSVVADIIAASGTDYPEPHAAGIAEHEREFAEETVDRDWAPRAEAEILSGFAQQTGLKLTSLQVECRATLCRVQMTEPHPDGPQSNPFAFVREMGLHPLHIRTAGPSSSEQSWVAYVSRFAPAPPLQRPAESTPPNPSRTDP